MFTQHSTYPWPLVITWPGDATGQHRLSHSLSLAQCESCLSFHLCPDRFGSCLTDSTLPCAVSHNLTVWSLLPDTNKCPLAAFVLSCSGPEKFENLAPALSADNLVGVPSNHSYFPWSSLQSSSLFCLACPTKKSITEIQTVHVS